MHLSWFCIVFSWKLDRIKEQNEGHRGLGSLRKKTCAVRQIRIDWAVVSQMALEIEGDWAAGGGG